MRLLCSLVIVFVALQHASSSATDKRGKCGIFERYKPCPSSCDRDDCSKLVERRRCDPIKIPCKGRCMCQDGYFRKGSGDCVPGALCFKSCETNEEWDNCPDSCDDKLCPIDGIELQCRPGPPGECIGRCVCKPDFYRDSQGKCVSKSACGSCEANEEWDNCPDSCDDKHCPVDGIELQCRPGPPGECIGRCVCKPDFYRDSQGKCVSKNVCGSCEENEEWDNCPDSCDDKLCPADGIEVQCRPGPPGQCIGRCVCKPDFYRDIQGNCVSKTACVKCQPYEIWAPSPDDCDDRPCPSANSTCIVNKEKKNKGKCVCKEGYYRDLNGDCTSKENCGKCPNKHEVFGCNSPCDITCAALTKPCTIFNVLCNPTCFCQRGYAKDKNKICIPTNKCNTKNSCKANEEFLTNGTACEVTCSNQNIPMLCIDQLVTGCFCKKGFIRDEFGNCIAPDKCPAICKNNEEWKPCPNSCDDMQCPQDGIEVQCRPTSPEFCLPSLGRCVCQPNFFRNIDGKCVLKETCEMQCKRNELWKLSPNNCDDQPCSAVNTKCIPNKRGSLEGRCVCADGYYRNLNGECASKEDCLKCTKDHEVFGCGSACDITCATLGKRCPIVNIMCNRKCYCQNGYARDKYNVCIPVEKCTTENSCKHNELFSTCGTACEETCANRGETTPCTLQCVAGCFCKKGFVRNASGSCIKPSQCPPDPTCGKNEEYKCESRCVVTCQNRHQLQVAGACAPGCVNSCYCKEGFIRNKNYECVPEELCDVECDRNEEWSHCRPQCGDHTCESLDNAPNCSLIMPQVCREGCVCAPGFYRNVKGFCVSKEQCDNQCDNNENYMACLECPLRNCELPYTSYDCMLRKKRCSPGCECADGFLRDFNNICIPNEQYPQCGENAHYTRCGSNCQNTCENPRRKCSPRCVPGCVCDEGYIRDRENGKCILPTKCPNNCDASAHEIYAQCKRICPAQECGVRPELILCAPQPCIPGCDCEEGFVRINKDGPCIPKSKCPAPQCKTGEVYTPCLYKCPPQTCWSILADIICETNQTCAPGCKCLPGYLRLDSGLCVPSDQCPQTLQECGENEYLQNCPVDCPTDNCATQITPIPQCLPPFPCQPAKCKCIASYKRNRDGVCVPANKCPCNKNETFSECGPACEKTCLNLDEVITCDGQCRRGCFCNKGFVRDEDGACIREEDCPDC